MNDVSVHFTVDETEAGWIVWVKVTPCAESGLYPRRARFGLGATKGRRVILPRMRADSIASGSMTEDPAGKQDLAGDMAVRLGTHRAPALREIVVGLDEEAHGMLGEVQVAAASLAGAPAEYRAEARLEAGDENLTRGWVTKAASDGDEIAIEVRNSVVLDEQVLGILSFAGIDHNEVAWSMSRWMGMQPVVPGLRPFREVIAVAMPVTGLEITDELTSVLFESAPTGSWSRSWPPASTRRQRPRHSCRRGYGRSPGSKPSSSLPRKSQECP